LVASRVWSGSIASLSIPFLLSNSSIIPQCVRLFSDGTVILNVSFLGAVVAGNHAFLRSLVVVVLLGIPTVGHIVASALARVAPLLRTLLAFIASPTSSSFSSVVVISSSLLRVQSF